MKTFTRTALSCALLSLTSLPVPASAQQEVQPDPASAPEVAADPATEPAPEPAADPATEPAPETAVEPASQQPSESAAKLTPEPAPEQPQQVPVATSSQAPTNAFAFYTCVSGPEDMVAAQEARAQGLPSDLVSQLIHYEAGKAAGLPTCEG